MSEQKQQFDLMTATDKSTMIKGAEDSILAMQAEGRLQVPPNYSVSNALNAAFLAISDTKDRNGKPAMEVCTKASIAKALLRTVVLGLTPTKDQIYYVVHANVLTSMVSYMGKAAVAKRLKGVSGEPRAQAIFKGDSVTYDIAGAYKVNLVHTSEFGNIDTNNVIGAYATINYNGQDISEVMTLEQCQKAWQMGAAKGVSPAHKGFPDEMCKKSVISRLCKMIVNTSDDSDILTDMFNDDYHETTEEVLANTQSKALGMQEDAPMIDID